MKKTTNDIRISVWRQILLLSVLPFAPFASATAAEPPPMDPYRQAILIGVWDYEHEPALFPMDADLDALSNTFSDLNFDSVKALANPAQSDIEAAIAAAVTTAAAEGARHSVLTVIYFGGHGTMVGNTSYLMARDFVRPTAESELIVSGALRTDYFARQFKGTGQPSLLIVEACRNPFTPAAQSPPETTQVRGEPRVTPSIVPMISAPNQHLGYTLLFGQTPGKPVEIAARAVGEVTPLVHAIRTFAPTFSRVNAFASAVRDQVMTDTANLQHPMEPELVDRGGGEIHLFYDEAEREADHNKWSNFRARNNLDLIRAFLAAYRTSPYTPVARWWLGKNSQAQAEQFASYTKDVKKTLGGRHGWFGLGSTRPKAIATGGSILTETGNVQAVADIEFMRRLPSNRQIFEARSTDGQVFRISGALPTFDPSRTTTFWADANALPILCSANQIGAGECSIVEHIGEFYSSRSAQDVGTLFVTIVVDGANQSESVDTAFTRLLSIESRLRVLNVPSDYVAFRNIYRSELPNAKATILIKRGDGKSLDYRSE